MIIKSIDMIIIELLTWYHEKLTEMNDKLIKETLLSPPKLDTSETSFGINH